MAQDNFANHSVAKKLIFTLNCIVTLVLIVPEILLKLLIPIDGRLVVILRKLLVLLGSIKKRYFSSAS